MSKQRQTQVSKFLSLVLRHQPQKIGIALDENGWVDVTTLLDALAKNRFAVTREELKVVVANCDKKRFSFSEDLARIRANQGHSVEVELGYQPVKPPDVLYHGTPEKFIESIRRGGLLKGQRHHVHLSPDAETATKVGSRRGRPVVLQINSAAMHQEGILFYVSDNGVWLTDHVPVKFLQFPREE